MTSLSHSPAHQEDDAAPLIDLDRYPVHDLSSPAGQALLADCRAQLAADGACNLPGFLRPRAAEALAAEAMTLLPKAYVKKTVRNAYFTPDDPSLPADDPRRRQFSLRITQIAYDQIPVEAGIRQLYLWDPLRDFIASALDKPRLHRFRDQFQAVNLTYLGDGDVQPWHFDQNDFTVTLLLQNAEAGGAFEYVPNIRSQGDENLAEVRRLFDGHHSGVKRLQRGPGTLTLFRGEYSAHRVSQVRGAQWRITAILLYDEVPDRIIPDVSNVIQYGPRAQRILDEQASRRGS